MTMATLTKTAITVAELDEMIERGESFLLLDVRNQDEFERWKIEGRNPFETLHIPYFQFIEDEEASVSRVPKGKPIVVVCAKGGSSDYVAGVLRERGYEAVNLEGGMIAWGNYYRVRRIEAVKDVALYQIIRVARGDLAYAVVSNGEGILIDPTRHTEQYTNLAEREGFKIVAIFDTHAHADHISGGPKLAKELGVPYFLHPYDGIHPIDMLPATIEYEYLKDGFTFQFGNATLKGIHIPGHTLGNMAFSGERPLPVYRRLDLHRVGGASRLGRARAGVGADSLRVALQEAARAARRDAGVPRALRDREPRGATRRNLL
jgi:rhodanese-related sulfurtransferase